VRGASGSGVICRVDHNGRRHLLRLFQHRLACDNAYLREGGAVIGKTMLFHRGE